MAALEFVPALVLAPFGGVLVDRIDKRRTLLVTPSLATVQVIVLFARLVAKPGRVCTGRVHRRRRAAEGGRPSPGRSCMRTTGTSVTDVAS